MTAAAQSRRLSCPSAAQLTTHGVPLTGHGIQHPLTLLSTRLSIIDRTPGGPPIELRSFSDERGMLEAFEAFVTGEADPDVLVTYDARGLGLVADRHAALRGVTKGAKAAKAVGKAAKGGKAKGGAGGQGKAFNIGREMVSGAADSTCSHLLPSSGFSHAHFSR